ncbi:MAG TPA: acyl-CoA desaturase [Acidimicrobiales bacterium]|jgi:stearoyl-CoA desaturase (delta-9 desaturase)|nr:acyl-CoA desaturase [Acidimicrobiales bacterium]
MTATSVLTPDAPSVPVPVPDPTVAPSWSERLCTAAIVVIPVAAVAWAAQHFWHHGIGWFDLVLAAILYAVTGHGIALGFHRLFTHRSFRAHRWLRITLAVSGSMAMEGSVISWVSHHRRHHVYSDHPGDPHSPTSFGPGLLPQLRGLGHAHVGWLFSGTQSNPEKWSRDLLADRDMVIVSKLTPLWMALTLIVPFGLGWAVTGSLTGALLALVWAGGVRIALLHHVTWSVNSLAHLFGKRPYQTTDHSGNIAWLALLSFGDSWHNNHHAFPALARHGCDAGQLDSSARLLQLFERMGWAWKARWPTSAQLATRRVLPGT